MKMKNLTFSFFILRDGKLLENDWKLNASSDGSYFQIDLCLCGHGLGLFALQLSLIHPSPM